MKPSTPGLAVHRPLLEEVARLARAKKKKLYLVGGAVRDIFSGQQKPNPDFDFCLSAHAIAFARFVAQRLGAGFVVLDREHGCARAVKKISGVTCTLDFSDFRAATLPQDLASRDFTVNSMALELEHLFSEKPLSQRLIDPCNGRRDWEGKILRISGPRAFDDDPVRIMRAFAFSALFGLRIERRTLSLLLRKKSRLRKVSAERIRDEFCKVLASPGGYALIKDLDRHRILEMVLACVGPLRRFNKGRRYGLAVWKHTLDTYRHLEAIINRNRNPFVKKHLGAEISYGRRRLEILKLAALVHDAGKPGTYAVKKGKVSFYGHERLGARMAGDLARELKFSAEEERLLRKLVLLHLRPGYLVTNAVLTARAKFRFFRDAGNEAIEVLLLALADERATTGYAALEAIRAKYERLIPRLMRQYCREASRAPVRRLLDGNDLMREFKLQPGRLIGRLLQELDELQALGKIRDRADALAKAQALLKKS